MVSLVDTPGSLEPASKKMQTPKEMKWPISCWTLYGRTVFVTFSVPWAHIGAHI